MHDHPHHRFIHRGSVAVDSDCAFVGVSFCGGLADHGSRTGALSGRADDHANAKFSADRHPIFHDDRRAYGQRQVGAKPGELVDHDHRSRTRWSCSGWGVVVHHFWWCVGFCRSRRVCHWLYVDPLA